MTKYEKIIVGLSTLTCIGTYIIIIEIAVANGWI